MSIARSRSRLGRGGVRSCEAGHAHFNLDCRSGFALNHRNGYREQGWDTLAGRIDLAIPKLSKGNYFPSFLEPRRTAEKALAAVI